MADGCCSFWLGFSTESVRRRRRKERWRGEKGRTRMREATSAAGCTSTKGKIETIDAISSDSFSSSSLFSISPLLFIFSTARAAPLPESAEFPADASSFPVPPLSLSFSLECIYKIYSIVVTAQIKYSSSNNNRDKKKKKKKSSHASLPTSFGYKKVNWHLSARVCWPRAVDIRRNKNKTQNSGWKSPQ